MKQDRQNSEEMTKYKHRLLERDIESYDVTSLELKSDDPKFSSDGRVKPFYGLTCVSWIDQQSESFRKLCSFQETLRKQFENVGLADNLTFLEPESFHMTICDIEDSSVPVEVRHLETRIQQVGNAFRQIGAPGEVTCRVSGLGLRRTIAALVEFDDEVELRKVLNMEREIKQSSGVDLRDFEGHVSLAYLVRHPGRSIEVIKEILLPHDDRAFGGHIFSRLDLTYFTDMNTFVSILTIDLEDGKTTRHDANLKALEARGAIIR